MGVLRNELWDTYIVQLIGVPIGVPVEKGSRTNCHQGSRTNCHPVSFATVDLDRRLSSGAIAGCIVRLQDESQGLAIATYECSETCINRELLSL